MDRRPNLQSELEELLGSRSVYYQPPESTKMVYPAIRFTKKKPDVKYANNALYSMMGCYEIIVISKTPDHPVIQKILKTKSYCSYDRHYVADNLNHDVLTLYY